MKMKSLKAQFIGAIAMVLVAAIAMGSSTYAWFSMNAKVDAQNMAVVAKSDNAYLLISKTNSTASAIQTENVTVVNFDMTAAPQKLYPAAPALTNDEVAYLTTSGKDVSGTTITTAGVKVTTPATAATVTNWYTANATGPTVSTIDASSARQLTAFTDYVLVETLYLTVAAGSNGVNNLTVTPTFTQLNSGVDLTAVKAIVTTSDGGFTATPLSSTGNGTPVDIKGNNTTLTDTTVRTVNVYLYVDGNVDQIYTNNMTNLKGVKLDLAFNATALPSGA